MSTIFIDFPRFLVKLPGMKRLLVPFQDEFTGFVVIALALSIAMILAGQAIGQTKPPLPPVSAPLPPQHALTWLYPTNAFTPDLVFNFYETNSPAIPQPWPLFLSVSITNLVTTNLDATGTNAVLSTPFTLAPGQYFIYATASNFWSFSASSNVTNTPPFTTLSQFALNIR